MLDFLKVADDVEIETQQDILGGGGVWDTGVYPVTCSYIYLEETPTGAVMAKGLLTNESTKQTINFNECVASKSQGTLMNTYKDKQTGEQKLLLGYTKVLSMAHAMGLGVKSLFDLDVSERTIKLYDYDAKADLPKTVQVFTDMTNVKLQVGIYRQVESVMQKDANGKFTKIPTAETRETNDFAQFFDADGFTYKELTDGKPAKFLVDWEAKHAGKVRNKIHKDAPKGSGPAGASAGAPPKKKLALNV